ncbi:MAG: type II secretion system protein [Sulfuricurvum sp.]|nr:type II secretion system protein [Sulfuricurvum sp.]
MRKGLTLIELILSMVIIGIVFTVIPRLIMSMNQSAQVTLKEEAMFNAVAVMGAIINLPWDENNTKNDQILHVYSTENTYGNYYDCNTTNNPQYYRSGGFIGSRNCRPASDDVNLTASSIGMDLDAGNSVYNDIDDYTIEINATNDCAKSAGKSLYSIKPIIVYSKDPNPNILLLKLGGDEDNITSGASNTKRIIVKVGYHSDNKKGNSSCITALEYHSFNLGNTQINSRNW